MIDEISIILCTKEVANVPCTWNAGVDQYTVKMEHEITVIVIPDYETNMATLYTKAKVLFFSLQMLSIIDDFKKGGN